MSQGEARWAVGIILFVVSAYVVPFTLLREVQAWYGSLLYWVLFALGVIGIVAYLTRTWTE